MFKTVVFLFTVSCIQAQTVTIPKELKIEKGRLGAVAIVYDGDDLKWDVPSNLDVFREYDIDPKKVRLRVFVPPNTSDGKYRITAVTCKGGKLSDFAVCEVIVGVSPSPGPVPIPPDPSPIKGMRVLIVHESLDGLDKEKQYAIGSLKVRDYLDSKCEGGKNGWRKWDKDQVVIDKENDIFKALWRDLQPKLKTSVLPVIVIVSGTDATIYPFPANEQALLEFLKMKGG